jgi:hypothetical protein
MMEATVDGIVIKSGNQRVLGGERVAVSGTLPVRERDGTVRARALVHTEGGRREVFEGDEVELGGSRYTVSIDVSAPSITLTPVAP